MTTATIKAVYEELGYIESVEKIYKIAHASNPHVERRDVVDFLKLNEVSQLYKVKTKKITGQYTWHSGSMRRFRWIYWITNPTIELITVILLY